MHRRHQHRLRGVGASQGADRRQSKVRQLRECRDACPVCCTRASAQGVWSRSGHALHFVSASHSLGRASWCSAALLGASAVTAAFVASAYAKSTTAHCGAQRRTLGLTPRLVGRASESRVSAMICTAHWAGAVAAAHLAIFGCRCRIWDTTSCRNASAKRARPSRKTRGSRVCPLEEGCRPHAPTCHDSDSYAVFASAVPPSEAAFAVALTVLG